MDRIARAISALTYDEITVLDPGLNEIKAEVPLLNRSIANDLRQIETALGVKGQSLLFAIAEAIDEALLILSEEE